MPGVQVVIGDSLQPPARCLLIEGRDLYPLSIATSLSHWTMLEISLPEYGDWIAF